MSSLLKLREALLQSISLYQCALGSGVPELYDPAHSSESFATRVEALRTRCNTNCYAAAIGEPGKWLTPGGSVGKPFDPDTNSCADLIAATRADGFEIVACDSKAACPDGMRKAQSTLMPGYTRCGFESQYIPDFHFYFLDKDDAGTPVVKEKIGMLPERVVVGLDGQPVRELPPEEPEPTRLSGSHRVVSQRCGCFCVATPEKPSSHSVASPKIKTLPFPAPPPSMELFSEASPKRHRT
jgi:hypothetical protein